MAEKISSVMLSNNIKAFVLFDGFNTPTIKASYNVSSVTDNAVGNYNVQFANPLQENGYTISGSMGTAITNPAAHALVPFNTGYGANSAHVFTSIGSGTPSDSAAISVAVTGVD